MAGAVEHNPQADHNRGDMEVAAQRSMYMRFNSMIHWCSTFIAALVAFLTLWLCAHFALLGAAVIALVIVGVGAWMGRNTGHNAGY
jgi:hypothetical protein